MNLNKILNSSQSGRLAMRIAQLLPPRLGFPLGRSVADWIATRRDLPMVAAIRTNQWVISGRELNSEGLDEIVRESIRSIAYSMYFMYHNWNNYSALENKIEYSPEVELLIERNRVREEGTMVVGIHSSNFDVALRASSRLGLKGLALSLPEANQAVEWQHSLRESGEIEIKPATLAVLREAAERLKSGGTVMTGVDRPMSESKYTPQFFGRPTALPVHYIYLALKTGVPVSMVTVIRKKDGVYRVIASDLIKMKPHHDRKTEILQNAETILNIAEDFIRQALDQWIVIQPLWPEETQNTPL
ncbi:lysophospholipid acyltransferase family protein [Chloroflexota bacterium]